MIYLLFFFISSNTERSNTEQISLKLNSPAYKKFKGIYLPIIAFTGFIFKSKFPNEQKGLFLQNIILIAPMMIVNLYKIYNKSTKHTKWKIFFNFTDIIFLVIYQFAGFNNENLFRLLFAYHSIKLTAKSIKLYQNSKKFYITAIILALINIIEVVSKEFKPFGSDFICPFLFIFALFSLQINMFLKYYFNKKITQKSN